VFVLKGMRVNETLNVYPTVTLSHLKYVISPIAFACVVAVIVAVIPGGLPRHARVSVYEC